MTTERDAWLQFMIDGLRGRTAPSTENERIVLDETLEAAAWWADRLASAFRKRYPDPPPQKPDMNFASKERAAIVAYLEKRGEFMIARHIQNEDHHR